MNIDLILAEVKLNMGAQPPEQGYLEAIYALRDGAKKKIGDRSYTLTHSRWRRDDDGADQETGIRLPDNKVISRQISKADMGELLHLQKKIKGIRDAIGYQSDHDVEGVQGAMDELIEKASARYDVLGDKILEKEEAEELEKTKPLSVTKTSKGYKVTRKAHEPVPGLKADEFAYEIEPDGDRLKVMMGRYHADDGKGYVVDFPPVVYHVPLPSKAIPEKGSQIAIEKWHHKNVFKPLFDQGVRGYL